LRLIVDEHRARVLELRGRGLRLRLRGALRGNGSLGLLLQAQVLDGQRVDLGAQLSRRLLVLALDVGVLVAQRGQHAVDRRRLAAGLRLCLLPAPPVR
jgi:hypothetical protein